MRFGLLAMTLLSLSGWASDPADVDRLVRRFYKTYELSCESKEATIGGQKLTVAGLIHVQWHIYHTKNYGAEGYATVTLEDALGQRDVKYPVVLFHNDYPNLKLQYSGFYLVNPKSEAVARISTTKGIQKVYKDKVVYARNGVETRFDLVCKVEPNPDSEVLPSQFTYRAPTRVR